MHHHLTNRRENNPFLHEDTIQPFIGKLVYCCVAHTVQAEADKDDIGFKKEEYSLEKGYLTSYHTYQSRRKSSNDKHDGKISCVYISSINGVSQRGTSPSYIFESLEDVDNTLRINQERMIKNIETRIAKHEKMKAKLEHIGTPKFSVNDMSFNVDRHLSTFCTSSHGFSFCIAEGTSDGMIQVGALHPDQVIDYITHRIQMKGELVVLDNAKVGDVDLWSFKVTDREFKELRKAAELPFEHFLIQLVSRISEARDEPKPEKTY